MAEKIFCVYLAKDGVPYNEAYAKLDLPATPWELWDVLDKLRLRDGEILYMEIDDYYCPYICELYKEFYIFRTVRPNSMSQTAGSEYEEAIITNYDPRKACWQLTLESLLDGDSDTRYELMHEPERPIKTTIKENEGGIVL